MGFNSAFKGLRDFANIYKIRFLSASTPTTSPLPALINFKIFTDIITFLRDLILITALKEIQVFCDAIFYSTNNKTSIYIFTESISV